MGEITAVEPPDSKAFSLRRTPETLAAHTGVGRFQRPAFSVGGLRRETERTRAEGVVVTDLSRESDSKALTSAGCAFPGCAGLMLGRSAGLVVACVRSIAFRVPRWPG